MTATLVLTQDVADELAAMLDLDVETGAVLLAKQVISPQGNLRLLGARLRSVPLAAYVRREALRLDITSDGYVPALGEAEQLDMVPIWVHTHPGEDSSPRPSEPDRRVDAKLSEPFRLRSGSNYYGSLIISSVREHFRFCGHLDDGERTTRIDRLHVVGARLSLAWHDDAIEEPLPPLFDRNIRAFGGRLQRVIGDLHIAVVGCGGTGSSVAEQLVRLGARQLLLIDPDDITESNLTRVYGSRAAEVGFRKVEVLANHLRSIAPDAVIEISATMITNKATAQLLQDVDVIFSCTDDNAGRLVLSRHAIYMLTPVIDCGVLLTSDEHERLDGIHGRVTVLHPGTACLLCRERIDVVRAGVEMLTPEERVRLADEGYAPALGEAEPSVVPFTTLVGAAAVAELLERFAAYGPEPVPSEIILRIHDREISTNVQQSRAHCYCHPESEKLGFGVSRDYLGMLWQE
jgi:molybdopterin/thiamine biosynthesis adenylyltransferase/proteasome lid subunit RPN8/RPN11